MNPICVKCLRRMDLALHGHGRVVIKKTRWAKGLAVAWCIHNGDEYICPQCSERVVVFHAQTRPRWVYDEMEVKGAVDISEK